ncbi:MAG: septum formation initiator family protein [Erysipelotrichaceae bacterium]
MIDKIRRNKKTKKAIKKTILNCFAVSLMILMCFFFWKNIAKEVNTTFELKAAVNETKNELDSLLAEKDHLENEKEKLLDDNYVSSVARGKYLITMGDEQVYSLPEINE